MAGEFTYERAEAGRDEGALVRMLTLAFAGGSDGVRQWVVDRIGLENLRVLRGGEGSGGLGACLARIPMGQFFGGRRVPMVGIAGVAVPPESRGAGAATRVMREGLREIYEEGVALSGLYSAKQQLYRRVGFEQAWYRFEAEVDIWRMDVVEQTPGVFEADLDDEGDRELMRDVYGRFAAAHDGCLDRGVYMWERIFVPRDVKDVWAFLIGEDRSRPEGYVILSQARRGDSGGRYDVTVHDFAATTARAMRRALGLVGEFRSVGVGVRFCCGPTHPWMWHLGDQVVEVKAKDFGMIRLVRVADALEGRGYSPSVCGEFHLKVRDELLKENDGEFVLRVEGGRGSVKRGGRGEVAMDVRALGSLYTGFASSVQLAQAGFLEGSVEAVGALGGVFGGGAPWMGDMF